MLPDRWGSSPERWRVGERRRVFLSHTGELRQYPRDLSFVAAAERAVARAGDVAVDMAYFGAHDEPPADFCAAQVRASDVYVGLIGFRYGSPTREQPDLSYTQLEFEAATQAGIPRLVFLLADDSVVPIQEFSDLSYGDRQRRFRDELRAAGIITTAFRSPADLETAVLDALVKLRDRQREQAESSAGPANGLVRSGGGGATVLVVGVGGAAPGPAALGTGGRRPWMVPSRRGKVVARPELTGQVLDRLLEPRGQSGAPQVVVLRGVGGFGKTTLAAEVCRRPEIAGAFPGGVLWVTLGESVSGATLADKINDLSEALSGVRPALADPEQAGFRLGELLGSPPRLLVVDDVWVRGQLAPFLQGGPGCVRLVTTRMRDLPPDAGLADRIEVAGMAEAEAERLLTLDLAGPGSALAVRADRAGAVSLPPVRVEAADDGWPPADGSAPAAGLLPVDRMHQLLDATGRWPVLLLLVNRALVRMVRDGVPPARAADRVLRRLDRRGPTAFDVTRLEDRNQAVEATLSASVGLLTGDELDRYLELAIFPEDADIPRYVLEAYWGATGDLSPDEVDDLCQELADLSLVLAYHRHPPALLLQDVLRSYLRVRVGEERLRELHGVLCDALRDRLLGAAGAGGPGLDGEDLDDGLGPVIPAPVAGATPAEPAQWWRLPAGAGYVWTHLTAHLAGAGRVDEVLALVRDLRWTAAKLGRPGLGLVALDADLALARELAPADRAPRALRRMLRQTAHLFSPTEPPEALDAVLLSRLDGLPALAEPLARFAGTVTGPRLVNRWSLPDQPHPGLVRVLPGHYHSWVDACVISPAGDWLASASSDGTVRLWEADTGAARATLAGHRGAVHACAIAPSGDWLVSGGADGTARVWPAAGGQARLDLPGHDGAVRGVAVAPAGDWLASCGDDGTVRYWDTATGRPGPVVTVAAGQPVRDVAISPDGRLLAAACEDGQIRLFADDGVPAGRLVGHRGPVRRLATCSGPHWLASVGQDGIAYRWDPAAGVAVARYDLGATGPARGCALSADGGWLAATASDGIVRLWETATGARHQLVGPSGTAAVCALAADGTWLVSAGRHGVLRIWDVRSADADVAPGGRDEGMRACVASNDGTWIVSVSEDSTAVQWDVATAEPRAALAGERLSPNRGGAIAPDDSWVAVPGRDGGVRLWEPATGTIRAVLSAPSEVRGYAVGPDGSWLAGACRDGVTRMWDTQSGEWLASFAGREPRAGAAAAGGPVQPGAAAVGDPHRGCVVAPDGSWVAVGGGQRDILVWDVATLEPLAVLSGHSNEVLGLAVAPDGRFLVSAGADHTVRVWWTDGWRAGPVLDGHSHTVRAAAVSADGAFVASAGGDGSARVWETTGWRCVTLMRFDGAARDCAWLPDGRGLVVAASGGLYLYDLVLD
ncbi:NB-ARC domain-containing protein [Pseudofrankia sp. DC12]|uniref:NB-ARC domain-containing protein n=1 Tax=Pseudofrankia sp. DC12 TaxID=683315 RepID=UPI0005F78B17|nr:NB-ARC domain-containing protein [Pseudofrankia sp. DC12]